MDRHQLRGISPRGEADVHLRQVPHGRGRQPCGKRHSPGQRGRDAEVVVDEEAAHASERVAERERSGGELHRPTPGHASPTADPAPRRAPAGRRAGVGPPPQPPGPPPPPPGPNPPPPPPKNPAVPHEPAAPK